MHFNVCPSSLLMWCLCTLNASVNIFRACVDLHKHQSVFLNFRYQIAFKASMQNGQDVKHDVIEMRFFAHPSWLCIVRYHLMFTLWAKVITFSWMIMGKQEFCRIVLFYIEY